MTSSNGESSSATTTTCAHAMTYAVRRSSAALRAPRHAAPSAPVAASAASASTRRTIPRAPVSGLHGTGRDGRASRGAGYDPPVRELTIEGRRIADDTPCFVIAEIGHNHQGSVEQAKELFRAARDVGVDAVKLQKRDNARLFTRELYDSPYDNENSFGATYGLHREALELDRDAYAELRDLAAELGLVFFATAFDEASADLLAELELPAYKIASGDLRNTPLLRHVAALGQADDRLDRRRDPRGRRPRRGDDRADQRPDLPAPVHRRLPRGGGGAEPRGHHDAARAVPRATSSGSPTTRTGSRWRPSPTCSARA